MRIKNINNRLLLPLAILFMSGTIFSQIYLPPLICEYSSLGINSITPHPNNEYEINLEICAGAGYGGAGQPTASFALILYGGPTFNSYDDPIQSPQTTGYANAQLFAPDTLVYINGGEYWTCISNICGGPHSVCTSVTIFTDGLPNAIFLIGMEGAGNPWASCMDGDMYVFPDPNDIPDICELVSFAANAGSDKTVYYGYTPWECTTLNTTISGSHASPVSYSWSNGGSSKGITVCPQTTTSYTVTATDSEGCEATSSVTVFVEDVSCGKNNNKVLMCNTKGETKCEKESKVAGKLNKGWTIGPCNNLRTTTDITVREDELSKTKETQLKAFPTLVHDQLFIEVESYEGQYIDLELIDFNGNAVNNIYSGKISISETFKTSVNTNALPSGIYLVRLVLDKEDIHIVKVIKPH